MADPVKIKVDLASGTVEVEATSSSFGDVFDRITQLLPKLAEAYSPTLTNGGSDGTREDSDKGVEESVAAKKEESGQKADETPRKKSAQSGKRETYKMVELGLDPEERAQIRQFFQEKAPTSQNEQTATLMDWLKKNKNKATVDKDEVYSAFRTVDAKSPVKISSVLGNMIGVGWVVNRGGGKYELIHVGEDYVSLKLPPKKRTKKA